MNATNTKPRRTYARIGTAAIVRSKCHEALGHGATLIENKDAGTVIATLQGEELFRAMSKGKGQPWIVIYSRKFYPLTA